MTHAILDGIRKGSATCFNMALIEGLTHQLDNLIITISAFFVYNFGMDLTAGRCLGMIVIGSKWTGEPSWKQKLIYSSSYSVCCGLLFASPFLAAIIVGAQIIAVLTTGKTTHGLLANMDSESMRNI